MARLNAIVPHGSIVKKYNLGKVIKQVQQDTGKAMKHDFEKTTATWETPVVFTIKAETRGTMAIVAVTTKSKVYGFVTGGTKPHVIRPKKAKLLSFQSGYAAKTRPGFIGSSGGGPSGPQVFAKEVHHPGTKARKFDEKIAIKYAYIYERNMKLAIAAAVRGK